MSEEYQTEPRAIDAHCTRIDNLPRESKIQRWLRRARKATRTPLRVLITRATQEIRVLFERVSVHNRPQALEGQGLLRATKAQSIDELWQRLSARPYPAVASGLDCNRYADLCPGDTERILSAAEQAIAHRVDLLGSGPIELGQQIDWLRDYKTAWDWPLHFFRDIDYNNPERPSDVKFPWEVSRMHWLIPAGQAYLLTGEERYAVAVRDVIDQWIESNPYAQGVNWACTMEVALRIVTWTWFFHIFNSSAAWDKPEFRERFLRTLYLHGEFTAGHLERSDVNGNHYTADAVGLVFAGLFFGSGRGPRRWQNNGWAILEEELQRQVYEDGVDFEGSAAYHRLVTELFLFAALYRHSLGMTVPDEYRDRVVLMARFVRAYTAPDGQAPLWGDADDARVLPFGGQDINDHRYLVGLVGLAFEVEDIQSTLGGNRSEAAWWFGISGARELADNDDKKIEPQAFPEAGVYILRGGNNHVFVDCGPVGLAGRGGHGHNDCLSFEAWLGGQKVITDSGAYLYTASYQERNRFRSTQAHNTPMIDDEEINRFPDNGSLWFLQYDAIPTVHEWSNSDTEDVVEAAHTGYYRLEGGVDVKRRIHLDKETGSLIINDVFYSKSKHKFNESLHLAPGVNTEQNGDKSLILTTKDKAFVLSWKSKIANWEFQRLLNYCSSSYGKAEPIYVLMWRYTGTPSDFTMTLEPYLK